MNPLLELGLLISIGIGALAIFEFSWARRVRPPKEQSLAAVKGEMDDLRTVAMPALGALVAGLLVSLAASFFYSMVTEDAPQWYSPAGVGCFVAGMLILVIFFSPLIAGRRSERAELALRDPQTIAAAAVEIARGGGAGLPDSEGLREALEEWKKALSVHSAGISPRSDPRKLDAVLRNLQWSSRAAKVRTSLAVFRAAVRSHRTRFLMLGAGPLLIVVGLSRPLARVLRKGDLNATIVGLSVAFLLFSLAVIVLYGIARGYGIVRRYEVNSRALADAEQAIEQAHAAEVRKHDEVAARNQLLDRLRRFLDDEETERARRSQDRALPPRSVGILGRLLAVLPGRRRSASPDHGGRPPP